jgi:DNA-binding MarR family transcriptional regulator
VAECDFATLLYHLKIDETMRIEDLSVNERILIHLRDFRGDPETSSTIEQTQEGIARAVGMRVNHVPRATKKLIEDGYIEDLLVHIGGLKRKRRAYFLTDSGAKIANDLLDKLRTQEVLFRDNTGKESTMKIDDIIFRTKATASVSRIALTAFNEGVVLETALGDEKATAYHSTLDEAPEPKHFMDREEERKHLKDCLEGNQRIIIISGMRGIGKSSLVRKVLVDYEGKRNILWYRAHDWDTARSVLEHLSDFFVRLGRNELKKLLRKTKKLDINLATSALMKDILASNTITVIDNVFDLEEEVMQLLFMVCERSRMLTDSHFIYITRDREDLTSTPCLGELGGSNEIMLKGLNFGWAAKLMKELGMEEDEMERVYGMTNGHPLALELVNSKEIQKIIDTKGLTREEIWVVRCLKAFDAIFE